jgi:Mce-associated membrane protein
VGTEGTEDTESTEGRESPTPSRVLDGATGQFRTEYAKGRDQVVSLIVQNKVKSSGQVLESGVVSSNSRHATVLLVVDSTVKNTAQPAGQVRHYRIQMQMSHEHGAWKASALEFVG